MLLDRLLWYEAHVRLAKRSADRLRVVPVILLPFYERFYVLRRNDLDLMAKRFEPTLPEECAGAGLDTDTAGRQRADDVQEALTPDAPLQHAIASRIGAQSWSTFLARSLPRNSILITSSSSLHAKPTSVGTGGGAVMLKDIAAKKW